MNTIQLQENFSNGNYKLDKAHLKASGIFDVKRLGKSDRHLSIAKTIFEVLAKWLKADGFMPLEVQPQPYFDGKQYICFLDKVRVYLYISKQPILGENANGDSVITDFEYIPIVEAHIIDTSIKGQNSFVLYSQKRKALMQTA